MIVIVCAYSNVLLFLKTIFNYTTVSVKQDEEESTAPDELQSCNVAFKWTKTPVGVIEVVERGGVCMWG